MAGTYTPLLCRLSLTCLFVYKMLLALKNLSLIEFNLQNYYVSLLFLYKFKSDGRNYGRKSNKRRRGSGGGRVDTQIFCMAGASQKQSTMEFLIFRLLGGFKAGSKCMEEAVSQLLQLSQQDAHASLGFCHVVLKNLR